MVSSRWVVAFVLPVVCACWPTYEQPGDCESSPSDSPEVELGFGAEAFATVADETEVPQQFGAQGGSHVWVAVRASGFDMPVTVAFRAVDAFSGRTLGSGQEQVRLNALVGDAAGRCERHGMYLYLDRMFAEGAGLADVTVAVEDAAGRTATAMQRVWIGPRKPACVPAQEAVLAPLHVPDAFARAGVYVQDGRVLGATDPRSPARVYIGAATRGFAASATVLEVSLHDPADPEIVISSGRSEVEDRPLEVPVNRQGACVVADTVPISIPEAWHGREAILRVTGDDGWGQRQTVERRVTLERADER